MVSVSFIFAVLSASTALAGHGLWEPKLSYQPASAALDTTGGNLHDSITSNGTAHSLHKRWLGFKAGSSSADDKLWPSRKIRYCWESAATKSILNDDLLEAAARWTNSGLQDAGFTYQGEYMPGGLRFSFYMKKYGIPEFAHGL